MFRATKSAAQCLHKIPVILPVRFEWKVDLRHETASLADERCCASIIAVSDAMLVQLAVFYEY